MVDPEAVLMPPKRLESLSPQLRKAARYVLDNPEEIATRSQRRVANAARLPPPTFTRLARAVGYSAYGDLKEACRSNIVKKRTFLADRTQALMAAAEDPDGAPFAWGMGASAMENLNGLIGGLELDELDCAAGLLACARRVVLIGKLSARFLIDYCAYMARLFTQDWIVLDANGEGASIELTSLGKTDACIAVSVRPYARRTVELASHVAEIKTPLVAVTDDPLSPLAPLANHIFTVGTNSPNFFPSHVAALAFIELMMGIVISKKGIEAQQKIAAVERHSYKFNDYWQEKPAS